MKVLANNSEDTQLLIGGSGVTGKFKVTDDARLMGMLSTNLYQNPLKTMLQEIMHNAWDAHKVTDQSDRPIEITITPTKVTVEDYGSGIDPEMIEDIYCTYGHSTKHGDSDQTGGFGLGSKSPYSYTESFTVTNCFAGKKTVYLMQRHHKDNAGGPGYDCIVQGIPTNSTGLKVEIPLNNEDAAPKVSSSITRVLQFSGIRAKLIKSFQEDEEPTTEVIHSTNLEPGDLKLGYRLLDKEDPYGKQYHVFAVYGGVTYKIPEADMDTENFTFFYDLARIAKNVHIGFAPDSLTPLPSREGLNMSEQTKQVIEETLEEAKEKFTTNLKPTIEVVLDQALDSMVRTGLQSHFLHSLWSTIGDGNTVDTVLRCESTVAVDVDSFLDLIDPFIIEDINWKTYAKFVFQHTSTVATMIGRQKFEALKWSRWKLVFPVGITGQDQVTFILDTQEEIQKITEGNNSPHIMFRSSGYRTSPSWIALTNKAEETKFKYDGWGQNTCKPEDPLTVFTDRLLFKESGDKFTGLLSTERVILAKNKAALTDTPFGWGHIMTSGQVGYFNNHFGKGYASYYGPVAAFIVYGRKGHYDKVKQRLIDLGIQVIESNEPEQQVRSRISHKPGKAEEGTYPILDKHQRGWGHGRYYGDHVTNPEVYLHMTQSMAFDDCCIWTAQRELFPDLNQYVDSIGIAETLHIANKLKRAGIPSYLEKMEEILRGFLDDKKYARNLCGYYLLCHQSFIPYRITQMPAILKLVGLPEVDPLDKDFTRDVEFIHKVIQLCEFCNFDIDKHLREELLTQFSVDTPMTLSSVRKVIRESHVLKPNEIWALHRDNLEGYGVKLIKFLKSV